MENILKRRSVRKFDSSKKITFETLKSLCKAGESAPSARNQKSRSYIIIDDKKLIYELSKVSAGAKVIEGVLLSLLFLEKIQRPY